MIEISADVSGFKDLEKALVELSKEVGAKKATGMLTSSMRAGAKIYQNDIINNMPVSFRSRVVTTRTGDKVTINPGFAKSRIKIKGSTNGKGRQSKKFGRNEVSRVRVGAFRVPYIGYIEYGTVNNPPNPVIRRAFERRTNQVVETIGNKLNKKIISARRKIAKARAA